MFLILGTVVGIILLGLLILKYIDGNKDYWAKQNIYQVDYSQVFKLVDRLLFRIPFQDQDLNLYKAFKKVEGLKYGGTLLFRHPILYVWDPELIKSILVKDFDHFINRRGIEFSDPKFQEMLFNMVNQEWKDMRTTMTPTFTTSKIKRMFGIFNESSDKMTKFLKKEIDRNGPEIEVRGVCGRYTMVRNFHFE